MAVLNARGVDYHQLLRVLNGKLAEQDLVGEREHRRVHADAQRERQHRDQRERRIFREASQRVPDVLHQVLHHRSSAKTSKHTRAPAYDDHIGLLGGTIGLRAYAVAGFVPSVSSTMRPSNRWIVRSAMLA